MVQGVPQPTHHCDPDDLIAYLKEQRADLLLINQRLTELGLAQVRHWMGHVVKALAQIVEARDLAWRLWEGPPLPADLTGREADVAHVEKSFAVWRKKGWKPKNERATDGKGKDEEERG